MTDQSQTAATKKLPPRTLERAIGWLVFEHGMSEATASEIMTGLSTSHNSCLKFRQQAIDVADFVEHLGYV
jgi:hypothetical protein